MANSNGNSEKIKKNFEHVEGVKQNKKEFAKIVEDIVNNQDELISYIEKTTLPNGQVVEHKVSRKQWMYDKMKSEGRVV